MLAMHKEILIAIADLRFVRVGCQHCKTRVVLDLHEPSDFSQRLDGSILSAECPGCRRAYDLSLVGALDALQKAYTGLKPLSKWIAFSIRNDDALPSNQ